MRSVKSGLIYVRCGMLASYVATAETVLVWSAGRIPFFITLTIVTHCAKSIHSCAEVQDEVLAGICRPAINTSRSEHGTIIR